MKDQNKTESWKSRMYDCTLDYDRCQERGFNRNNNEASRLVKRWEFTKQLCDCQLLTLASDPLTRSGCLLLPNRYFN